MDSGEGILNENINWSACSKSLRIFAHQTNSRFLFNTYVVSVKLLKGKGNNVKFCKVSLTALTLAPVMGPGTRGAFGWRAPGSRGRPPPGDTWHVTRDTWPRHTAASHLGQVATLEQVRREEHLLVRHAVLLSGRDEGLDVLHQHEGRALFDETLISKVDIYVSISICVFIMVDN